MQITHVPNQGWDARIMVCRCGNLVDTWIVVTDRYVVIIDTMDSPASGQALLELARPHMAGRQLLVLNTHSHWDHVWGNQVFSGPHALYPAPILATRRCAELLRSAEAATTLAEMQARQPDRFATVQLVPASLCFEERLQIDGGDLTLELLPAPGHAADQVVVWIPEIGTLLAADAAELPFPFANQPDDLPVLRQTLAMLEALAPRTALYCHAAVTGGPAVLRANMDYFDTLEARCRAALALGVAANPPEDADLEKLVGFPFSDVRPLGLPVTQPEFYQPGHQKHIRFMLEWLGR